MTVKPARPVERARAIESYRDFLANLGYDVENIPSMCSGPSGKDTAVRAVDAYIEFFSQSQEYFQFTMFPAEGHHGMVVLANIEFASMCAHHMLPYTGVAHVGYIPKEYVCGLSKIARAVEHYAHRPSIQETLSAKIATFLWEQLEPTGVMVIVEAQHMCMALRGIKKPGHLTITSEVRGVFEDDGPTRAEFMSLIQRAK